MTALLQFVSHTHSCQILLKNMKVYCLDKSNEGDSSRVGTVLDCFGLVLFTDSSYFLCLRLCDFRHANARFSVWSFMELLILNNNNWSDGLKCIRTCLFLLNLHEVSK